MRRHLLLFSFLISGGPRKIYQSSVSIFGYWIWFLSQSVQRIASCRRGWLREKGCDISPASFPLQKVEMGGRYWACREYIQYAFHEFPQLRPSTQIHVIRIIVKLKNRISRRHIPCLGHVVFGHSFKRRR